MITTQEEFYRAIAEQQRKEREAIKSFVQGGYQRRP